MDENRIRKLAAAEDRFVGGSGGAYLLSASTFAVSLLSLLFYMFFMLSGAYEDGAPALYAYLPVGAVGSLVAAAIVFFALRAKNGEGGYVRTALYAAFCFADCALCGYLLIRDAWMWNCDPHDLVRFGGFMSSAIQLSFIAFAAVLALYAGACFVKAGSPDARPGVLYPISCLLPLSVIACVLVCIRADEQPGATYLARALALVYCSVMLAFSARYLFKAVIGAYLARRGDSGEYERVAAEIESVTERIMNERAGERGLAVEGFPSEFETLEIAPEPVADGEMSNDAGQGEAADLSVIFTNEANLSELASQTRKKAAGGKGGRKKKTSKPDGASGPAAGDGAQTADAAEDTVCADAEKADVSDKQTGVADKDDGPLDGRADSGDTAASPDSAGEPGGAQEASADKATDVAQLDVGEGVAESAEKAAKPPETAGEDGAKTGSADPSDGQTEGGDRAVESAGTADKKLADGKKTAKKRKTTGGAKAGGAARSKKALAQDAASTDETHKPGTAEPTTDGEPENTEQPGDKPAAADRDGEADPAVKRDGGDKETAGTGGKPTETGDGSADDAAAKNDDGDKETAGVGDKPTESDDSSADSAAAKNDGGDERDVDADSGREKADTGASGIEVKKETDVAQPAAKRKQSRKKKKRAAAAKKSTAAENTQSADRAEG